MPVKMVCADLDGTLLFDDHNTVSRTCAECIAVLAARGVLFVPATGRSFERVPAAVKSLPELRYLITSNGAQVYDFTSKKPLYSRFIDREVLTNIVEFLDAQKVMYEICRDDETLIDERRLKEFWQKPGQREFLKEFMQQAIGVSSLSKCIAENPNGVHKLIVSELTPQEMALLHERLTSLDGISFARGMVNNIEITAENVNKFTGVQMLCGAIGITPDDVLSFGDNDNDVTMLKGTGLSYAVENATEAAKAAAKGITASNQKDGVAIILQRLLRDELC